MKISANMASDSLQLTGKDGKPLDLAVRKLVITFLPQEAVHVEMVAYADGLDIEVLKEHCTVVLEERPC